MPYGINADKSLYDLKEITDRITALENIINTVEDETYSVNSSITCSRGHLRVIKIGNKVFISGGIGNATSTVTTSTNLFAQLPAKYRPLTGTNLNGWVNDAEGNISIRTDGYIRQTLASNMNNCFFSGFYTI